MIAPTATPEAITAFLRLLDAEASESAADGEWIFADGEPVFRCTTSARRVADAFGGRVVGFSNDQNPAAEIAADEGGHDFALIAERFVVDYWASFAAGVIERPVFDLLNKADAEAVSRLYGPSDAWRTVVATSPRPKP